MHHATVHPNVHHILGLVVVRRLRTEQIYRVEVEPRVDTVNGNAVCHGCDEFLRARMQFTGDAMSKQRNGHAPSTLARDTPVRAIGDHGRDAVLAPSRRPSHLLDALERTSTQALLLHADEPLRGSPKNQGCLMAPAVRVAMVVGRVRQQPASLTKQFDNTRVRFEHLLARHIQRAFDEAAIASHRVVHWQAVLLPYLEVFHAVARCGVHAARARVERYMVAKNDRHHTLEERVVELQAFKLCARGAREHFGQRWFFCRDELALDILGCSSELARDFLRRAAIDAAQQFFRHHDQPAIREACQHIGQLRTQRHGLACGQRPRRGGPDDDASASHRSGQTEALREIRTIHHRIQHIDGGAGAVFVFHFGFGQRTAAIQTPMNGLETLHHMPVVENLCEGT